ncbi:MAG: heavy metal translocating P-type ATPase [Thermodesulfovibrionia bacterium]
MTCDHCLSEIKPEEAVYDEIDGRRAVFCCTGCNAIYRIIHEQGLDEFYEKRLGWKPGRPELRDVREEDFREFIKEVSEKERELEFIISGIRCASCIWLIEHILKKTEGVTEIRVNYATHRARLRWSPQKIDLNEILKKITSLGYTPKPALVTEAEEELKRERRDLLIRFGTAAFFSMQLMIYTSALYAGYFQGIEENLRRAFQLIAWALATPVMFYCGYPFMRNTMRGLKNRALNMDVLIFLGSFSAYAYSVAIIFLNLLQPSAFVKYEVYFDTSAMIITLILLGRYIEQGAKLKASSAIQALLSLQPLEARLLRGSEEILTPVKELKPDDMIIVRPGEKIPADGVIINGSSEIDESMLTGESMPVFKEHGSEVFSGTININGRLIIRVKTVKDTLLSKITQAVLDAQTKRPRIQGLADRIVGVFVPAIIMIALSTFLYWSFNADRVTALMNAVSVLVIACPCALGLATPLAILIGSTGLYSSGIIIKDGNIIEKVAMADTICIDKTGTLTEGKPSLIKIISYEKSEEELHLIAGSIEHQSEHAVAKAITRDIKKERLLSVKNFQSIAGMGVKGMIDNQEVLIGNIRFLESSGIKITESQRKDFEHYSMKGYTITGLAIDGRLHGWFIISDRIAPSASMVIMELKKKGKDIVLLTGDQRRVAEEVSKALGIEKLYAEVLPVEKAEIIKRLKAEGLRLKTEERLKAEGGRLKTEVYKNSFKNLQPKALSLKPCLKPKAFSLIMVGDGINDAPALAVADAGIATGGATDIAMESAQAVLMKNDISLLIPLINISEKTLRIIKQNLFWAFSYNIVAIPLAVSGRIHPIISALLMALSSLLVVGNSLRLKSSKYDKIKNESP